MIFFPLVMKSLVCFCARTVDGPADRLRSIFSLKTTKPTVKPSAAEEREIGFQSEHNSETTGIQSAVSPLGIHPEGWISSTMDLYKVLNVGRGASMIEIKMAYRKMAKKFHPDLNPNNRSESEAIFKQINHAYEVLSDIKQRSTYDRDLGVRIRDIPPWDPKNRPFRPRGPTIKRPPGFTINDVYDVKTWYAWHYGDDPETADPFREVKKKEKPMTRQEQYVSRQINREQQQVRADYEMSKVAQQESIRNAAASLRERREKRHQSKADSGPQKPRGKEDCTVS